MKSTTQNVESTDSPDDAIPDNKSNSPKVSDVPDNFLDEGQAQLFLKISHELSDYITFADPVEFSKTNRVASTYVLKQWTQQEKEKIEEDFAVILHRVPGLLLAAGGNSKLVLCRLTSIPEIPGFVTRLETESGFIMVPDAFFLPQKQLHFLTHELIHLADSANHLSFSDDWTNFANPPIAYMRRKIKHASPKHLWALDRSLRQNGNGVFPDLEGYDNLSEAFASYFTEYIDGSTFPCDPNLVKRFGPHFLLPTPQDLRFTEHFVNGQVALCAKNFDLASTEFCAAKALDPGAARAYLGLSTATRHDLKLALEYCREACHAFEAANVPRTERYYAWANAIKRYLERSISAGPDHIIKPPNPRKYLDGD